MQLVPTQQSAVVVHDSPAFTQDEAPQTNAPAAFGTHGVSQQSALEAQAVPGGGGPSFAQSRGAAVHRGIPSTSS